MYEHELDVSGGGVVSPLVGRISRAIVAGGLDFPSFEFLCGQSQNARGTGRDARSIRVARHQVTGPASQLDRDKRRLSRASLRGTALLAGLAGYGFSMAVLVRAGVQTAHGRANAHSMLLS